MATRMIDSSLEAADFPAFRSDAESHSLLDLEASAGDDNLGAFRGLLFAVAAQSAVVAIAVAGWELWRYLVQPILFR